MPFFGGVEGGGTNTSFVVVDDEGKILGEAKGPASNPWLVGLETAARTIVDLSKEARGQAGISEDVTLDVCGLSISGCEQKENQERLEGLLRELFPNFAKEMHIYNDTVGSLFTASAEGGMVVISGTGTMAQSSQRDEEGRWRSWRTGGWGHMLGEEGSAYWIASEVIKTCIRALDGFVENAEDGFVDVKVAWEAVQRHFAKEGGTWEDVTPHDLVGRFYGEGFDKAFVASLTKSLAQVAEGDGYLLSVFERAGKQLGAMVRTLAWRGKESAEVIPVVRVVCVGSVWKSFPLLKSGFEAAVSEPAVVAVPQPDGSAPTPEKIAKPRPKLQGVQLVQLRAPAAIGAAFKAAIDSSMTPPKCDFDAQVSLLHEFRSS